MTNKTHNFTLFGINQSVIFIYKKGNDVIEKSFYCSEIDIRHREDGPALIGKNDKGFFAYFINDKKHRIDGPCVNFPIINKILYHINDKKYTEEEYYTKIAK